MRNKQTPDSVFYFASTHWDREWYLPFQSFRSRLVTTMEEILDTLENDPAFSQFILDGQTVPLEDYLAVKKEDQSRLTALLTQKRLLAGPWYTMPDENLVSGESLICNLFLGHQAVSSLTGEDAVLPLGYLCDCFGHIAQMPQILNGFHISSAILGRGTNEESCPSFFLWEAPDKSRCAVYKVPESCGYGTFFYEVYAPSSKDVDDGGLLNRAVSYIEKELQRSCLPYVLLMDGMDHTSIHPQAPGLLKQLKDYFSCSAYLGSVDILFQKVWENAALLPVLSGELRQPAKLLEEHNRLIPGTLSSRYDLKKKNDVISLLLEKLSLPMAALSLLKGSAIPPGYADTAYRYLLKNHAHDSICGCSIDEVHRDMHYRFRQAELIGREICHIAMARLTGLENASGQKGDRLKLTIFHPFPFSVTREAEAELWLPPSFPCRFDEMVPSENVCQFRLIDADGKEVPYQITNIQKNSTVRLPGDFYGEIADRYQLVFTVSLPAMGYTEYKILPSPAPVRFMDSMKTGDYSAENDFLRLELHRDGSLELTDKLSGHCFHDLISFKDNGETGDGWTSRPPVPDRTVFSSFAVSVECTLDGPCACSFCITHILHIPECMDYNRQYTKRSERTRPLQIKTHLTLWKHTPYLKCRTVVENNCLDHKLTLSLRTGIPSETYMSEQAFAFIERPAGTDPRTNNWKEADCPGKSFSHIVYRSRQDGSGLAFLSCGGLHEAGALTGEEGRMDICLFRSFGKTFLTDGQPDGQLQGTLSFDYALLPVHSKMTMTELVNQKDSLALPLPCFTSKTAADYRPAASKKGFSLSTDGLYLSLLAPGRKNPALLTVRLVNYSSSAVSDILECPLPIADAWEADLLEEPLCRAQFSGNRLMLTLPPHKIQTFLLMLQTHEKTI